MKNFIVTIALCLVMLASVPAVLAVGDVNADAGSSTSGQSSGSVDNVVRSNTNVDSDANARVNVNAKDDLDRGRSYLNGKVHSVYSKMKNVESQTYSQFYADVQTKLDADAEINSEKSIADVREDMERRYSNSRLKVNETVLVSAGSGWAISSNEGSFARILLVDQSFTNTTNNNTVSKTGGFLQIGDGTTYRLRLVSESDGQAKFNVTEKKGDRSVGTFTLESETNANSFTVWDGTFTRDSGQTYDVNLATKDRLFLSTERGYVYQNSSNSSYYANGFNEGKVGFWARIKGWFS